MATTTKLNSKNQTPKTKVKAPKVVKTVVTEKVIVTPVVEVTLAGKGRVITGKITSDKMTNTVVVEVTRLVAHPMYQKRMRRTNKFHAHNTMGAKAGDQVEITECRPISKTKNFIVTKIIK